MLKLVVLCSVFIPIAIIGVQAFFIDSRIIGGHEVNITEYPYQVRLDLQGKYRCGGSIISRTWIITAAQCIVEGPASDMTVRVGTSHQITGGQLFNVSAIIVNANYTISSGDYDIALIQLKEPIALSELAQTVRLPDNEDTDLDGRIGTVTGWGRTTENGNDSRILRAVDVPVVNRETCNSIYNSINYRSYVTERMLCTGFMEGDKNPCKGDGGAPLVVDSVLTGIAGWSNGCASPGVPHVYTNVAAFRDWITDITGI
ncbi:hypothetical protein NQ315_011550 [Exocentrus adspersus]|uniref:trypsin n=1 Tax=Exocentrus adspersus TaxID=1586481 RepID=A0AAV8VV39_9CUCU|nr:hypothetical protein NQ315_011550 [Exocentrus adspersus]